MSAKTDMCKTKKNKKYINYTNNSSKNSYLRNRTVELAFCSLQKGNIYNFF